MSEKLIGDKWDNNHIWRKYVERRVDRMGCETKGTREYMSERILEVVEQVDELRTELKELSDTVKKIGDFVKKHYSRQTNGDSE